MGNYLACRAADEPSGKVLLPDGTVFVFEDPVCVAELMLEHPQQFVTELHAKPVPLPADHLLDPKKAYTMLPMGRNGARKLEEARRILSGTRSVLQLWPLQRAEDKANEVMPEKAMAVESSPQARMVLLSRELSSKGWKPSLGTIEEKELDKKVPHWLF